MLNKFSVLFVLAIAGCISNIPDTTAGTISGKNIFENKTLGYSMVLPDGWSAHDSGYSYAISDTYFYGPVEDNYHRIYIVVTVRNQTSPRIVDDDAYFQGNISINGLAATQYLIKGTRDDLSGNIVNITTKKILLPYQANWYEITAYYYKYYDKYRDLLDASIMSFKIL